MVLLPSKMVLPPSKRVLPPSKMVLPQAMAWVQYWFCVRTPNGKCHPKFPFWFSAPLPNTQYRMSFEFIHPTSLLSTKVTRPCFLITFMNSEFKYTFFIGTWSTWNLFDWCRNMKQFEKWSSPGPISPLKEGVDRLSNIHQHSQIFPSLMITQNKYPNKLQKKAS